MMVLRCVKLKQLLIWLILSLLLSACTTPKTYQVSHEQKNNSLPQVATSIKQDIASDPRYQKGAQADLAKEYIDYVNWLVEQVQSKKISAADGQALLYKTYKQFKSGKYYQKKENMMDMAPEPPPSPNPQQIPEKPGAL